jgi:hypothetical protein
MFGVLGLLAAVVVGLASSKPGAREGDVASEPTAIEAAPAIAPPSERVARPTDPVATVALIRSPGFDAREAEIQAFVAKAAVTFTEEEQAEIAQNGLAGLPERVSAAERDYLGASSATRQAAEKRYTIILNLAAKVTPSGGSPPAEDEKQREKAFRAALAREEQTWRGLSPADREARAAALKRSFLFEPRRVP